jgi:lipoate-protein ligase A
MDLIYAIPLIALLAAVWVIVRHIAAKARRRRDALRKLKRRSSPKVISKGPDSASERSDMRRTDAPATFVDTIQKRTQPPAETAPPSKPRTER